MDNVVLVIEAQMFAIKAHRGLKRPNRAQEPYSHHLREVATLVQLSGGSAEEIAAAWLHDSVEDTKTTLQDIEKHFGPVVMWMVSGLTDPLEFKELTTLARKRAQAERVRFESRSVKRVKLADQTANMLSVAIDAPRSWNKQKCIDYMVGARLVALACADGFPLLARLFSNAHEAAVKTHSRS